jgi:RNA polymerase sigma-70 factor (ECF subfamily)
MEKKTDNELITLYQSRTEIAISKTKNKYGKLIYSVAYNMLKDKSDAEECENDTYLALWKSIPPTEPRNFKAFCLKITRNFALKKLEHNSTKKRDSAKTVSYDEILAEAGELNVSVADIKESDLSQCIDDFLETLDKKKRKVFVLRYWYMMSVKEIMDECGMSKSQVETILFRVRTQLKNWLVERRFYHG